jgi:hypothetical protein
MRNITAFFFAFCIFSTVGNSQLLNSPSLTVQDFELALTNNGHLKEVLKKHAFTYSTAGQTRLVTPGTMPNPLMHELVADTLEEWEPTHPQDGSVLKICLYEWKSDCAPLPEVYKTIRIIIRRDSEFAYETNHFLEAVKNRYPHRSEKFKSNIELYMADGELYHVFTNDSKIEVRMETQGPLDSRFYILNFDLIH